MYRSTSAARRNIPSNGIHAAFTTPRQWRTTRAGGFLKKKCTRYSVVLCRRSAKGVTRVCKIAGRVLWGYTGTYRPEHDQDSQIRYVPITYIPEYDQNSQILIPGYLLYIPEYDQTMTKTTRFDTWVSTRGRPKQPDCLPRYLPNYDENNQV